MPYVNCSVPLCVASTRKTPNLRFYRLPRATHRRSKWIKLMGNSNLTLQTASFWTSICALHFVERPGVSVRKHYTVEDLDPSLFPWSREWPDVIRRYNDAGVGPSLPILTPESIGSNASLGFDTGIQISKDNNELDLSASSQQFKFHITSGVIDSLKLTENIDEDDDHIFVPSQQTCNREPTTSVMPSAVTLTCTITSLPTTPFQQTDAFISTPPCPPASVAANVTSLLASIPSSVTHAAVPGVDRLFFNPYQSSQVVSRLTELWRLGRMCDAALCIGKTVRMNAHRLVLASVSPMILDMGTRDGHFLEIQLPDNMNVEAVHKFLTYIYEGILYVSPTTVDDIERIANILNVSSVLAYCSDFRKQSSAGHAVVNDEKRNPRVSATPVAAESAANNKLVYARPIMTTKPFTSMKSIGNTKTSAKPSFMSKSFLSKRRGGGYDRLNKQKKPISSRIMPMKKPQRVPNGRALEKFLETNPCLKMESVASVSHEDDSIEVPSLTQIDEHSDEHNLLSKLLETSVSAAPTKMFKSVASEISTRDISNETDGGFSNKANRGFSNRASPLPTVQNLINLPELTRIKVEPEDPITENTPEINGYQSFTPVFPGNSISQNVQVPSLVLSYESKDANAITVTMSRSGTELGNDYSTATTSDTQLDDFVEAEDDTTSGVDVSYQFLPIPDEFLNDLSMEQQRRYMASILERQNISHIPESERQYQCAYCPAFFVKAKSCVGHVIEAHDVISKDSLRAIRIEQRHRKAKCEVCGETSFKKWRDSLAYHMQCEHGAKPDSPRLAKLCDSPRLAKFDSPKVMYSCGTCNREFLTSQQLASHIDEHETAADSPQGLVCALCEGLKFRTSRSLRMHLRTTHVTFSDEGPECLDCGESLTGGTNIVCHFQTHARRPTSDNETAGSRAPQSPSGHTKLREILASDPERSIALQGSRKRKSRSRKLVSDAADGDDDDDDMIDGHVDVGDGIIMKRE